MDEFTISTITENSGIHLSKKSVYYHHHHRHHHQHYHHHHHHQWLDVVIIT